jgi:hypothetical protein
LRAPHYPHIAELRNRRSSSGILFVSEPGPGGKPPNSGACALAGLESLILIKRKLPCSC